MHVTLPGIYRHGVRGLNLTIDLLKECTLHKEVSQCLSFDGRLWLIVDVELPELHYPLNQPPKASIS